MGQAALQHSSYSLTVDGKTRLHRTGTWRRAPVGRVISLPSHSKTLASEVAALGIILALLQISDGILTAIGMVYYGTSMEGNLLLRELMGLLGTVPALVLVKTLAIGVVTGLCLYAYPIKWLKPAFKLVIGLYLFFAVLPWSVILATEFIA
jgi:hypothetical protein